MKPIVIIPTYNEAENLPHLVPQILKQDKRLEILIVDDGSPDGTGQLADRFALQEPRVFVLHRTHKAGLAAAYIAGFKWALSHGADVIFQMDADFSHDPSKLPDFLKKIQKADLVLGSRYTKGGGTKNWPFWRQLISRGGSLYAQALLNTSIKDITGGFKCFRRQVLERLNLDEIQAQGYGFQIELTHRVRKAGFQIEEIPILFADRQFGHSKMDMKIVKEAFWLVLKLAFNSRPQRNHPSPVSSKQPSMPRLPSSQSV